MAQEPLVREELSRLRARLSDVTGSVAATADGLVLAHDPDIAEADGMAALTAAALAVAVRLSDAAGQGAFRELLVRGDDGYVATYAAGELCVLTVLAGPRTNVGRLHMEARRSGACIAQLVDGARDVGARDVTEDAPPP